MGVGRGEAVALVELGRLGCDGLVVVSVVRSGIELC
jgi:hypothetical protein